MQIKEFLNTVCEQIKYKPIRQNIAEELKNHVEEIKENYIAEGISEEMAETKAIEQMGNGIEIGKKLNKIHKPKLDWKLVIILVILVSFGFLVSMTKTINTTTMQNMNYMTKFIIALVIGTMISVAIYFFDYTKLQKYSKYFYLIATITVIGTILCGTLINGVPNISLGMGISISASTIAMPLYILAFIGFLVNTDSKSKLQKLLDNKNIKINIRLIQIILLSILSLVLLLQIPSIVSSLILGGIYMILGTVKIWKTRKNRKKKIGILWVSTILITTFIVIICIGNAPYIIDRIKNSFQPENDPQGGGWLGVNRDLIIQSAQNFGEAEDTSTAITLFDEGTNYALISILAHYGWVITISIMAVVLIFSIKLMINSIKIKDLYGKLITIGISSMFILQSVCNILMNFNLGMEANFNLPFISYGGSNLIINLVSLALILSVYRRKDIITIQYQENISNTVENN